MPVHTPAHAGDSESDGASAQDTADAYEAVPTADSDESHQNVVVTVPPLDKTVFVTWNEFHEYLAEYQQRTFQIYSIRTGTPVSTRNKRIKERYMRRGLAVPPGELLPEEMATYSKAVVCTHHGRPRSRATGVRARQPSRAINCPAQITLVLRRDYTSGKCFVHVSSHTTRHNHALSDGQYRRHPMIRKITDPSVLRTVHTLQKADVEPAKILKYVREHTDKEVMLRDVHNMLASFRKSPPPPSPATMTPPARGAPPPSVAAQARLLAQTSTLPERPPHFSRRRDPRPSPPAVPARELPTQYGQFLAAFNVGKEIAELMAEMDPDRFAQCFAELRMFLRIAESGRAPVVTTREAIEHVQSNFFTGISNTPQQQAFQLAAPNITSSGSTAAPGSGEATNSLISPSQPYTPGQ
ncbi:hypothetical protein PHYPSEUDO_010914 [Phytophthora pseudosyringae]|uniref:FAR1 domain-containing protein n=1 Tax=Phytophthora pseudosyringae TaxID=221518 RepID=A0A8T1V964_9STRA|nr:hypothetical protein PHYPSEUDO_010914 [Phytophthora pseudosyringae]